MDRPKKPKALSTGPLTCTDQESGTVLFKNTMAHRLDQVTKTVKKGWTISIIIIAFCI